METQTTIELFVHYEDSMSSTIHKTFQLNEEDIKFVRETSNINKIFETLKHKYIPDVGSKEYRLLQEKEDLDGIEQAQSIYSMHNFFTHSLFSEFEHTHFYNAEHSEDGTAGEYVLSFYKESGEQGDRVLHIILKSNKREAFPKEIVYYLVPSKEERERKEKAHEYDPWDFDWSDPYRSDTVD